MKTTPSVVGLAWFRPEQWERLREISVDRDGLEATHEEWKKIALQTIKRFRRKGVNLRPVEIDVEELLGWCVESGREVDGKARAEFAAVKLRQSDREKA